MSYEDIGDQHIGCENCLMLDWDEHWVGDIADAWTEARIKLAPVYETSRWMKFHVIDPARVNEAWETVRQHHDPAGVKHQCAERADMIEEALNAPANSTISH